MDNKTPVFSNSMHHMQLLASQNKELGFKGRYGPIVGTIGSQFSWRGSVSRQDINIARFLAPFKEVLFPRVSNLFQTWQLVTRYTISRPRRIKRTR